QRNAALRLQPAQASVWDPELVRSGELLAETRRVVLKRLDPYWQETVRRLTGLEVELHYFRGWSQDHSLMEGLTASRDRDLARGITHPGPHRGDVLLRLSGRPAREILSRGQQKL